MSYELLKSYKAKYTKQGEGFDQVLILFSRYRVKVILGIFANFIYMDMYCVPYHVSCCSNLLSLISYCQLVLLFEGQNKKKRAQKFYEIFIPASWCCHFQEYIFIFQTYFFEEKKTRRQFTVNQNLYHHQSKAPPLLKTGSSEGIFMMKNLHNKNSAKTSTHFPERSEFWQSVSGNPYKIQC